MTGPANPVAMRPRESSAWTRAAIGLPAAVVAGWEVTASLATAAGSGLWPPVFVVSRSPT